MAIERYGLRFPQGTHLAEIERQMCRKGGQWTSTSGKVLGNGLAFHFRKFQEIIYGDQKMWHTWNILQMETYLKHRTIAVLGPSSSGKTNSAATDVLADYLIWPDATTVLICSTTKERLQDRIFGEIKKYHRIAKGNWPSAAGHMIEGRLRIVTDQRSELAEGRDFRNGVIGVACLSGGDFRGISEFIGIKNKRMRVVIDEIQMLPPAILLSLSNLDKNPDFKALGLGNPKETTDALGNFAEPAYELGGWDGGIDQTPKTKTWPTRRPDGICIQLVGLDSPNLDGLLGIPLITQAAIDRDIAQYGKDSLQFTMMNMGMMPRGQGSRRIITRQLCLKNRATDDPDWRDSNRIRIGFLDAAYRGVGGDRCVFGELQFGQDALSVDLNDASFTPNIVTQSSPLARTNQIMALIDIMVVPVNAKIDVEPEDQIVAWVKTQCISRGIEPENFFFDSGMKTALVSSFARSWSPATMSIDCGGSPSDRMVTVQIQIPCNKYFKKRITELWYQVRNVIEAGQFRGMKDGVMQEGCQREWTITTGNLIEVEPKLKMKEKTGRSPDFFDALAIGVEGAIQRGFYISNTAKVEREEKINDWHKKMATVAKKQWSEGALDHSA